MLMKAAGVLGVVLLAGCGSVTPGGVDAGAGDVVLEHAAGGSSGSAGAAGAAAGASGTAGAAGAAAGSSGGGGAAGKDAGTEAKSDGGYPPCSEAGQTPESQIDDCFPTPMSSRLHRDGYNCIRSTTGEDLCLNLNRSINGAPPVLVVKACAECVQN